MGLGPGKIVEGCTVTLFLQNPQVHLKPAVQPDAGLGLPLASTSATSPYPVNRSMTLHPLLQIARMSRSPMVSLRRRKLPAGSRRFNPAVPFKCLSSASAYWNPTESLNRPCPSGSDRRTSGSSPRSSDPSRKVPQASGLGRLLQAVDGVHLQLFVENFDFLGPQPLELQELGQARGHLERSFFQEAAFSGGKDLPDLFVDRLADSRISSRLFPPGPGPPGSDSCPRWSGGIPVGTDSEGFSP